MMGKSEAVRQGKVFLHKIGVIALVQRRKNRMLALLTMPCTCCMTLMKLLRKTQKT